MRSPLARAVLVRALTLSIPGVQMGTDEFKTYLSRRKFDCALSVSNDANGGFILIPRRRRKSFPLRHHVYDIVSS